MKAFVCVVLLVAAALAAPASENKREKRGYLHGGIGYDSGLYGLGYGSGLGYSSLGYSGLGYSSLGYSGLDASYGLGYGYGGLPIDSHVVAPAVVAAPVVAHSAPVVVKKVVAIPKVVSVPRVVSVPHVVSKVIQPAHVSYAPALSAGAGWW